MKYQVIRIRKDMSEEVIAEYSNKKSAMSMLKTLNRSLALSRVVLRIKDKKTGV